MHSNFTPDWKMDRVDFALRQVTFGHRGYPPFTYRGLVEFLVVAKEALDSLGDNPSARQQATHQLVYDGMMEPTEHIVMPKSLGGASDSSTGSWMPWER